MFGISGEHLLILGIVLLIFGPRRLPELGNTLGKAIRNFKDAISGIDEAQFRRVEGDKDKVNGPAGGPTAARVEPDAEKVAAAAAPTPGTHEGSSGSSNTGGTSGSGPASGSGAV